ncbi:Chromosome segregation protein Spo0J, contains ParB-like nuclease domain [Actinoplanes regularis]|uniref:Chromosome segregation protein Spo0J, contains ParB-like nuclease domain n=2 Tax=Actinoplanes regularis TaxID=52697 RepID=A0A238X5Q4_9ACTN|nr:Chromosome segregation protein Spo0J, contains ParB-like nuclease domain [Actinoplanes regularis]
MSISALAEDPMPTSSGVTIDARPAGRGPWVVPLASLSLGRSPRQDGTDEEHVARLAEVDAEFPPILVDRRTMEVIDGAHRFMAAVLNGEESISVEFFDGTADDAFLCAVEANVKHGLPLSRADRRAAAARIIVSHTEMSDRAIAEVVGMAAKTVAEIRHMTQDVSLLPTARVGRDGRIRPLSTVEGRLKAAKILADQPQSSLREVAKNSGISPSTVADVRRRLARGEDPIREGLSSDESRRPDARFSSARRRGESRPLRASLSAVADPASIVTKLADDPSLRYKQAGRQLLRLLQANASSLLESASLASAVPSYSAPIMVQLARRYAQWWDDFAQELEGSARLMPESRAREA